MIISSNGRPAQPSARAASIPLMRLAAGSHSGRAKKVRSLSRHFFRKCPKRDPFLDACQPKLYLVSPPHPALADLPKEDSPSIAVRRPSVPLFGAWASSGLAAAALKNSVHSCMWPGRGRRATNHSFTTNRRRLHPSFVALGLVFPASGPNPLQPSKNRCGAISCLLHTFRSI